MKANMSIFSNFDFEVIWGVNMKINNPISHKKKYEGKKPPPWTSITLTVLNPTEPNRGTAPWNPFPSILIFLFFLAEKYMIYVEAKLV